ncbi:glycogen/starch synthase [Aquimarina sp. MMG016]|uniref:glycogen synthase n=1 Tax=Aquimarina sp. MMG016 TaxID=2822690 RepID=UPI001B3A2CB3|nr:glycogen/starch synthase [Aquimarina sp. MMG016]MBQ4819444.1 glycogen/starch synthase [Aquimarina sp. MMG016]
MKILHTSFECYPIAKVGGLADVVGALPRYQNELENQSSVIMPYHDNSFTQQHNFKVIYKGKLTLGSLVYEFSVRQLTSKDLGFDLYTIHTGRLLDRQNVYGYKDDTERFIVFQKAVLDWLQNIEEKPDIIHCHDHHTGLIPFLMTHGEPYESLRSIPTILTIHNAQYQGQISYDKLHYLPSFDKNKIGLLDWSGCINPLASAIKCAWKVTTVSPSYMKELQVRANGLENLLSQEKNKSVGILNGIDAEHWNPKTDSMLVKNYSFNNLITGRKANKKWLCEEYELDINRPLFAFIGRLVGEKGADILPEIITETINNTNACVFMLGSGDPAVEKQLEELKKQFQGRYNAHIGYDEELSHKIYAGADFLLMPSRVEPCGLNQMYALRYGTVPVVRRVGGLKDTVVDIGDNGFGICHDQVLVWDVCYSIKRAINLYNDQEHYKKIQKKIMKIDHSWNRSAQEYVDLYNSLIQLK